MKGDKFDFYVSSYYQAAATSAPLTSPLLDIVNGLSSGVSGSSVLNTHGVTNTQLQTAFTPNVTGFLNTQPPYSTGSTIPLAYVNWVLFDEQFNLVRSTSSFERVSAAGIIEPHARTGMPITQSGYLYIYVSNTTPNIPVYFDNLKVKHIRGALLETNEFYPYGLKMANISYRAASTLTNRYGWNGGNEYEDEGELNYSNTFYRKYDAQIGRFTGVDMYAESYADMTPYQFGANNPVMFNDPMGDRLQKGEDGQYHPDWYNDLMAGGSGGGGSYNGYGSGGGGGFGGFGGGIGGGQYDAFWGAFISSIDFKEPASESNSGKTGISLYFDNNGNSLGSLNTGDGIIASEINNLFSPIIQLYLGLIEKTKGLSSSDLSTFDKVFRSFGTSYDVSSFIKYDKDNRVIATTIDNYKISDLINIKVYGKPAKIFAEVYGSNYLVNGVVTAGKKNAYQQGDAHEGPFATAQDRKNANWVSDIHNHHEFYKDGPWTASKREDISSYSSVSGFILSGVSGFDRSHAEYNIGGYRSVVVDAHNVYLHTTNLNNTIHITIP
jgi:RHS repeat-associated protein